MVTGNDVSNLSKSKLQCLGELARTISPTYVYYVNTKSTEQILTLFRKEVNNLLSFHSPTLCMACFFHKWFLPDTQQKFLSIDLVVASQSFFRLPLHTLEFLSLEVVHWFALNPYSVPSYSSGNEII